MHLKVLISKLIIGVNEHVKQTDKKKSKIYCKEE